MNGRNPSITHAATGRPQEWLTPDWPAPPGVAAFCTTRHGGVSQSPFDSLNLATHVGDDLTAVQVNRQRWRGALQGVRPVLLNQVHGREVVIVDATTPDDMAADAACTTESAVACVVLVADCLPVLFCDTAGTRVAAAHAGWRGLAAGVLTQTLQAICLPGQAQPAVAATQIIAWLGPCIGPAAFEIGPEVRAALLAAQPQAVECFRPGRPDRWLADLAGLARRQLQAQGVTVTGNDGTPDWCTVTQPTRYFSYRRDGRCGRMAAAVWLR